MRLKSTILISATALLANACATTSNPPLVELRLISCDTAQEMAGADDAYPQSTDDYMDMLDCLGHADPEIRDGFAYGRLADALRNRMPDAETRRAVGDRLMQNLTAVDGYQAGFLKPFSVLVLSEVARTDRIDPYLTSAERSDMVRIGTDYLQSVRDYRGFETTAGWRHGVAHAADLMLQLAVNEQLSPEDGQRIFDAIASQILPADNHSYIFGESRRLARPLLFLALGGHVPDAGWADWFARLNANETDPVWQDPYMSREGLATLHNTRQFASAVIIWASESDDEKLAPLAEGAKAVMASLP